MIKRIGLFICGILFSLFFFPFEFTFLPGINTKMMLAVLGVVVCFASLIRNRSFEIPRELFILLFICSLVSFCSLFSITLNDTPDNTYVTYIISAAVWLSAAYFVCSAIHWVHGRIGVDLLVNYLVAVCLFQCTIALVMDFIPSVRSFIDQFVEQDQLFLQRINRLYGIGAQLDVAGSRFAVCLVAISFMICKHTGSKGVQSLYLIAFILITTVGNMIARTTLVGSVIGLAYLLFFFLFNNRNSYLPEKLGSLLWWITIVFTFVGLFIVVYRVFPPVRNLIRFAFEGFFNLAEKGYWETSSTNKLVETMVVFPDNLKTWLIGDGYFLNSRYDPNYLGNATDQGFYMGTDIGYLRFIFYFGIPGLLCMVGVILYSTIVCIRHFQSERALFVLSLLVGLTVWFKVSTDIFLFNCLFLCASWMNTVDK